MNKTKQKALLALTLCGLSLSLTSCGETNKPKEFTVSFKSFGQVVNTVQVANGKRITSEIADPTAPDSTYTFLGWFKEESANKQWKFDIDIVTSDITLYAGWRQVTEAPSELKELNEAFSNGLSWLQGGVSDNATYSIKLYKLLSSSLDENGNEVFVYDENGIDVPGSYTYESTEKRVTWLPTTTVEGGQYKVTVTTETQQTLTGTELFFKGNGTSLNPYLVVNETDLESITKSEEDIGKDKIYKLYHDMEFLSDYEMSMVSNFTGTFDGNGKRIRFADNSNSGIFGKIGKNGTVKNLIVDGVISTGRFAGLGSIANSNEGTIENCLSYAGVTSTAGSVADFASANLSGAGGLVGINNGTIKNSHFAGTSEGASKDGYVKAAIGGGGIAGTNNGTITDCVNTGYLGAYNSTETGKTLSAYSYAGGIAGFNYGTIKRSSTESIGKILAQRASSNDTAVEANNIAIGGIAGYNGVDGIIDETKFEGIRIHGDQAVGGIVGINEGVLKNSYSHGKYYSSTDIRSYIGGRIEVGGIAGRVTETGSVINCYNTANVFGFGEKAYSIAPKASNSVGLAKNLDGNSNKDNTYGKPFDNNLLESVGNSNVLIQNQQLEAGNTDNYCLDSKYLTNLGEKFEFVENDTIRLKFESENDSVNHYTINFYNGTELLDTKIIKDELEAMITMPNIKIEGYTLEGWALEETSEITFAKGSQYSYAQLSNFAKDGIINLYAKTTIIPVEINNLVVGYLESSFPVVNDVNVIEQLKNGFDAYLLTNNIKIDNITFKPFTGKVAAYTGAIVADGTIDILIGCGGNIDTSPDSAVKENVLSKQSITILGDSTRYFATLNLGGNSKNLETFITYLNSEEGKGIINPIKNEEQRTDTLKVGFWIYTKTTKLTEEMVNNLKIAFNAYLVKNNISIANIEFSVYSDTAVSDIVDKTQQDKLDILVGAGATIGSAVGTTSKTSLIATSVDLEIGGTNRKLTTITGCSNSLNAASFSEFINSSEAKAILNPSV